MLLTTLLSAFTLPFHAASIGVPNHIYCAYDDSPAIWTGQTQYANGHSFYQFKCLQGHEFWVRGD